MTAVQFFDGMDFYDSYTGWLQRWTGRNGTLSFGTAHGRNGTNGLGVDRSDFSCWKVLPAPLTTHFIGFAMRINGAGGGYGNATYSYPIMKLFDSIAGQVQVTLGLNASRQFEIRRASNDYYQGTVLATGTKVLSTDVWYYVEWKVKIDDATGTVQVRINGVDDIPSTGSLDTKRTANASADQLHLQGGEALLSTISYDDLYWMDDSGSAPRNTFLGDVRIQALLANGAGAHSQWTPSAGSNYQNIDDATPNDDTDYNSDATAGDRDTFAYGNLVPTTGSVLALQVHVWARKDDAGTRQIATVVRHSGTDYDGTTQSIGTTYTYYTQIYEQNPGTSADWTIANVNTDDEFGVKLVA